MCGFIGMYSKEAKNYSSEIEKGLSKIAHRGNEQTYVQVGNYYSGYTRLKTDGVLSQEKKYLQSLLYNGIIYNTPFLKDKFHLRATDDFDSVILQEGFKKFGRDFIAHIRGMFAFAFQDDTHITLVRDCIGIKPLYYTIGEGIFAFASEMKALGEIAQTHNLKIIEVVPGEIIKLERDTFEFSKQTFTYVPSRGLKGEALIADSLDTTLIQPTKKYITSGKKIAILLSGGLDSSVLVYSLFQDPEINTKNIMVFSMGLVGSSDYEATKIIEKNLDLEVIYLAPLSEEQSLAMIEDIVYITESPLSRVIKVAMFQYVLAQEIRNRGIDIVISGEGSDEIFYGYKRFYEGIKNTADIDMYYNDFFEKVFFYTLLQRLDRSFSHFTIEGRVPFLDQELVHGIRNTHISEKLQDQDDKYLLRKYALSIGIPKTIVYRKKEKMTRGITSQENNYTNNLNGYLENICFHKHSSSLSDICLTYYKKYFYHQGKDLHKNRKLFLREEDII